MSETVLGNINTCHCCGIQFAIHKDIDAIWQNTHKTFYCPNGHSLWYPPKEKELDKLKLKVSSLEAELSASNEKNKNLLLKIESLTARLEIWEPRKD